MIDARFVPIHKWPGKPNAQRRHSDFTAKYAATLDLLETELGHLLAKDVLIQAYFEKKDIRNDGWPRSGARPKAPGVVLSFDVRKDGKVNAMSFPCDRFDSWEDNLRAIAKSLEALRMVDRYGVTQGSEQYQGFAALPSADPNIARNKAIAFISTVIEWSADHIEADPNGAYRMAASYLHPDRNGSHERFVELQNHWEALKS